MSTPVLECKNLCYSYHNLNGETKALSDLSFRIDRGEFVAIVGPSGCGKITYLSGAASGKISCLDLKYPAPIRHRKRHWPKSCSKIMAFMPLKIKNQMSFPAA